MTTIKQVTTSMTFEVTVTLIGTEVSDETGADVRDVALDTVGIDDTMHSGWIDALKYMTTQAQKGDWENE